MSQQIYKNFVFIDRDLPQQFSKRFSHDKVIFSSAQKFE